MTFGERTNLPQSQPSRRNLSELGIQAVKDSRPDRDCDSDLSKSIRLLFVRAVNHNGRLFRAQLQEGFSRGTADPGVGEHVQAALLFLLNLRAKLSAADKILRSAHCRLKGRDEAWRNKDPHGALCPSRESSLELRSCHLQINLCLCAQGDVAA